MRMSSGMRVALRVHHGGMRLLEGMAVVAAVRTSWTSCGRHGGSCARHGGSGSVRGMGMGRHGGVVVVHGRTRRGLVANERGEGRMRAARGG